MLNQRSRRTATHLRGKLWAFSGLDGAGKSTQIQLLTDALQRSGARSRRIWARGGYTPGFSLLKKCVRILKLPGVPATAGRTPERQRALQRGIVRTLWLNLAIFDLAVYYGVWLRWLRVRGINVVADRYVVDTHIDFLLNFPEERVDQWWTWKVLTTVVPAPDEQFVFLIPVQESLRRSAAKQEPVPDDEQALSLRLSQYQRLTQSGRFIYVDGTRPPADVHGFIARHCGVGETSVWGS